MSTISAKREQIISGLRDKESRDAFFEEQIDTGLPFRIRALRRDRGWSQKELADRLGIPQEGISRLENPNYGKFTLATLKRVASAFDVALVVRFEPFSNLVDWVVDLTPEDLAVPDFDHDPGIHHTDGGDLQSVSSRAEDVMLSESTGLRVTPTILSFEGNVTSIEPYLANKVPADTRLSVAK